MPAPTTLLSQSRKERRKQERLQKKRKHSGGGGGGANGSHASSTSTTLAHDPPSHLSKSVTSSSATKTSKKETSNPSSKKRKTSSSKAAAAAAGSKNATSTSHVDPSLLAAIHQDDLEIAALEAKLFKNKKKSGKHTLHKEYAKLEGYGDDFGDFLDDLDDLERRIKQTAAAAAVRGHDDKDATSGDEEELSEEDDDYDDTEPKSKRRSTTNMDSDLAAALDRDDEEIAQLEKKLGIHKPKEKSKLHKEYQQEGYGDDFGDFLDDLDDMMARVKDPKHRVSATSKAKMESDDEEEPMSDDSEDEEELVPMKGVMEDELEDLEEDDSVMEDLEAQERLDGEQTDESEEEEEEEQPDGPQEESEEESVPESEDESPPEPDHDVSDTYRPQSGQDIYGNRVDGTDDSGSKRTKYVPPHLRNQGNAEGDEAKMREIKRGLNNALNRLSEDTLISVAQQVAQLYSSHPTQLVHDMLWKNTKDACVQTPVLMKGLIPVYIACVCGVHIQTGDTVQVGEFLLEVVLTELWKALAEYRERLSSKDGDEHDIPLEVTGKHICNQMLILCYLYNYNVVHCTFMYDIIRHFIDKFTEIDVECLLLLLSHCGRSLRSDDPLALKEIVLLVQRKNAEASKGNASSRAEYMVSAIMDLKNNKRGKQDDVYNEKTAKLRKALGRIKSTAAKTNTAKTVSEASLRISLEDILQAETKGRWWKVGASWVGNQYRFTDNKEEDGDDEDPSSTNQDKDVADDKNEALLQLATKLRMNSDRKRSIFCIIMGSEDCEDAFEKLCRGGMLQNKSERDTCRVLLECCCHEPSYNKFYGYLAARMCEFQPQCKFSLQLAFWDLFKQMEDMGARKAVNVAKFLFDLIVVHQLLRMMTVIKVIDLSEGNDLDETTLIFLTVLLSNVLDHFSTTEPVKDMFGGRNNSTNNEKDEGVRGGLLLFFMETLKNSPKNTKGTQFHKNFKAAVKVLDTDGFEDMF